MSPFFYVEPLSKINKGFIIDMAPHALLLAPDSKYPKLACHGHEVLAQFHDGAHGSDRREPEEIGGELSEYFGLTKTIPSDASTGA